MESHQSTFTTLIDTSATYCCLIQEVVRDMIRKGGLDLELGTWKLQTTAKLSKVYKGVLYFPTPTETYSQPNPDRGKTSGLATLPEQLGYGISRKPSIHITGRIRAIEAEPKLVSKQAKEPDYGSKTTGCAIR